MSPEEYCPIPPTKTQKAVICLPEEVQMRKDENQTLKTRIAALEAECALFVEPGSALEAAIRRIRELEAQVTALKKIAEDECAASMSENGYPNGPLRRLARRQLAEEHPETFR